MMKKVGLRRKICYICVISVWNPRNERLWEVGLGRDPEICKQYALREGQKSTHSSQGFGLRLILDLTAGRRLTHLDGKSVFIELEQNPHRSPRYFLFPYRCIQERLTMRHEIGSSSLGRKGQRSVVAYGRPFATYWGTEATASTENPDH